jgi:8-hydroxy-5-deazaflavin:NADPH oxidoreductase
VKIGIVGGTGGIGEGMAMRLSQVHEVRLGSRDPTKAGEASRECHLAVEGRGLPCAIDGSSNQDAADFGELVVLAVPFKHLVGTLGSVSGLEGKVVVSPVNPMERREVFAHVPPPEGSAAQLVQRLLPDSKVVAAFNAIAANRWRALDEPLDYAVPVCGDDAGARRAVLDLVGSVSGLTGYDAGPLETAGLIESLTPLLLNVARYSKMRDVGIQFR